MSTKLFAAPSVNSNLLLPGYSAETIVNEGSASYMQPPIGPKRSQPALARPSPISVQQFNSALAPSPSQMTCASTQRVGPPTVTSYCDFAFRVYEFNRRLQQHEPDNRWWEALIQEFFEDDAVLTITVCLEDGPNRFTIGRSLIGRYFRSIYESGVIEHFIQLYHPRESFRTTTLTLDCENAQIVTQHIRPMFSKVICDGHLVLDFMCNELMRIRSWSFTVRSHHEFIPRNMVGLIEPTLVNHLSRNITHCGITSNTLSFLKLSSVLEPMQVLMARHKNTELNPRECLRSVLQERWQALMQPMKPAAGKAKRGQKNKELAENGTPIKPTRKKRNAGNASDPTGKKRQKADDKVNQNVPNFAWKPDVMVVGEPKQLSAFYIEDERAITRVENGAVEARHQFENDHCNNGNGNGNSNGYGFHSVTPGGCRNQLNNKPHSFISQNGCESWNGFGGSDSGKNFDNALLSHGDYAPQPYRQSVFGNHHQQQLQNSNVGVSFNISPNPSIINGSISETWQIPIANGHCTLQY